MIAGLYRIHDMNSVHSSITIYKDAGKDDIISNSGSLQTRLPTFLVSAFTNQARFN